MKNLFNKKIAIVGGGPGGLTLARLLQIKGADVKVYERDANKDVRVQGATLDLHDDSGLEALRKAGLMDAFKENYRPNADRIRIVDSSANTL
ncbi:FAD-dependent monooxygenase [Chitinophagaceae bacterium 26-R-25]|nr:FAD-dependent monooxygenase [Chitinophagaceae bacterium 26-R-25]